jgi:hypothetical protein
MARLSPDYAEFIIGPAEGRTRWLHPGYGSVRLSAGVNNMNILATTMVAAR